MLLVVGISLAGYIYATALKPIRPVGFQRVTISDPGHQPIAAAIWYPTDARPGFAPLGTTGERVATDGAVIGGGLPLVVISHGTGASSFSHADTGLHLPRTVLSSVAPTQYGRDFQDDSDVGKPDWLLNRSGTSKERSTWFCTAGRIAGTSTRNVSPFSALRRRDNRADQHRRHSRPATHRLALRRASGVRLSADVARKKYRNSNPQPWHRDMRIRAAVIAAPGLGFTFAPAGLSNVHVPGAALQGASDQTVPFSTNGGLISTVSAAAAGDSLGAGSYPLFLPDALRRGRQLP